MIEISIPTIGEPPAFNKQVTDSDYWISRLCFEESKLRYALNQAGHTVKMMEQTDLTAAETAMSGLSDYLKTWFDGAVVSSAGGSAPVALDKSYIPEIVQFIALAATGQWGLIFVLFCKVGLEFLLDSTEKKLDPSTATGDLQELLKQVLAVLDENGNIVGSKVDGLANLHISIRNILSEGEQEAIWSASASNPT